MQYFLAALALASVIVVPAKAESCTQLRYTEAKPPKYPEALKAKPVSGTTVLRVLVDTDGKPREIQVEVSSGYEQLDAASVEAANMWRFVPTHCDGKPQESWALIPFRYGPDEMAGSGPAPSPTDAGDPPPTAARDQDVEVLADKEPMEFATAKEGAAALRARSDVNADFSRSKDVKFFTLQGGDGRVWVSYEAPHYPGNAIVRMRAARQGNVARNWYAVLCEGPEAWCRSLGETTAAFMRENPMPVPPPRP
ncbi:energy transducer TonB [Tahibacter amnicola]|uniref:Energy transducer TonB n=1 Tax=Tahibacter amnicola TaxID=2976241 RepID=A0ABY6BGC6_9GAMM|nr:energy transducer TonB [Tahibacter amnicola]UXI68656.1 energy transducer TonB [Tahibacter amnicola]